MRAEPEAVACDALELGEHGADVARARRHLQAHQLLDRLAVAKVVARGRHVVDAIGDEDDLLVVALLAELLDAAVQVADHDVGVNDALAIQPQHDTQHAVRAGMLRTRC